MNECVTDLLSAEHKKNTKSSNSSRRNMKIPCMRAQLWFRKYIKKKKERTKTQTKRRAEPDNNSQYLGMNTAALDIKAF